jgi:hypothetical protein
VGYAVALQHVKAAISRKQPLPYEPFAYSIKDAAGLIGISPASICNLIARKELRPVRIAGRTLIPRNQLVRLVYGGEG